MKTVAMFITFSISEGMLNESSCLRISTVRAKATRLIAVVLNLSASITDDDPVEGFNGSPIKR